MDSASRRTGHDDTTRWEATFPAWIVKHRNRRDGVLATLVQACPESTLRIQGNANGQSDTRSTIAAMRHSRLGHGC